MNLATGHAETYADSGSMVIALLLLTKKMENTIAGKLSDSILYQLSESLEKVGVLKSGNWKEAQVSQIRKQDCVRIKAGATVPFDGILESPRAFFNRHLLSGENTSLPAQKGDSVLAGSIAHNDFEMRVTGVMGDRRIDRWAESALVGGGRNSAPSKMLLRFESSLTAAALAGAVFIAILQAVQGADTAQIVEAFFIGILIFCPCLFASIIPLSKQMAYLALLRKGVLIHRAEALLQLNRIKHIYLDKTGTLEAVESELLTSKPEDRENILALLDELSEKSHHPILRGFTSDQKQASLIESIQDFPGQGLIATTLDHHVLCIGQAAFVSAHSGAFIPQSHYAYPLIALDTKIVGQIAVKNLFDSQAKKFLIGLLKQFKNLSIEILSGDPNPSAGQTLVALDPLRISYHGNLAPEAKAAEIKKNSLYVGDGLNDTLALSKADVSCRIGPRVFKFAPVDMQLQIPDMEILLQVMTYAKKYRRVQIQTAGLALVYNLIAFSLAAMGKFSPVGAALAMLSSFFLLFLSSLRLLKSNGSSR